MLNKYTVIYRHLADSLTPFVGPEIRRKDVTAQTDQEAARLVKDADILHVIKHEPIDHSQPQVRFLSRCLPDNHAAILASEGCHLAIIECRPTTDLDFVRHELWHKVLEILDLGDVSQCDQYLLDDALNDADIGDDHPFRLDEWPYDRSRFEIFEADKEVWVVIDWKERRKATFDCHGDALKWCTPPYEKAVLIFEVWPGRV